MTLNSRNQGTEGTSGPRCGDDELAARIAGALRSRESWAPEPAFVAARIEAELARRAEQRTGLLVRRGGRVVVTGAVTGALAVAGAGAAAAASPYSGFAAAVESAAAVIGIDWSVMPDGLTRDQYEAFQGAGFTPEDDRALQELWGLEDFMDVKARAGQMILDGEPLPVLPGSTPQLDLTVADVELLQDLGYTVEDAEALADLWEVDHLEAKARAVQMLQAGEPLPVEPSGPVTTP